MVRRALSIAAIVLLAAASWQGCQRKLELGFDPGDGGAPDAGLDGGADTDSDADTDTGVDASAPDGSTGDGDGGVAD